jgi:hypothetical protein
MAAFGRLSAHGGAMRGRFPFSHPGVDFCFSRNGQLRFALDLSNNLTVW